MLLKAQRNSSIFLDSFVYACVWNVYEFSTFEQIQASLETTENMVSASAALFSIILMDLI